MRKNIILLVLMVAVATFGYSQNYGYCNGGNIVEALALKNGTDQAMENFSAPLIKQGQDMLLAYKEKEKKFYTDIEQGILSQIAIQKREKELIAEARGIESFEKEVADKIQKKREELLQPILEKVQAAIDEVAKAGSYSMIFDESLVGAMLYAESTNDIGPMVRSKLGL